MQILRFPDANEGGASSDTTDVKPSADSSTAKTGTEGDVKEPTLLEAVQAGMEKVVAESSTADDAKGSDSKIEPDEDKGQSDEGKGGQEEDGGKKEDSTTEQTEDKPEEGKVEEGKPVPYDRFNEVLTERNTVKQEYEAAKPRAAAYDQLNEFCEQYSITKDQFAKVMRIQALLNTDPAKALQEITPIVDALQGFVGNKLPADLQVGVDEGKLTLEWAKELAQGRAQKDFSVRQSEHQQRLAQQNEQRQLQQQVSVAVSDWTRAKMNADPDYTPKSALWEEVNDRYIVLSNKTDASGKFLNPVNTAADVTALLQKSYDLVKGKGKVVNKPIVRKPLSSSGSSTTGKVKSIEEFDNIQDMIAAHLK